MKMPKTAARLLLTSMILIGAKEVAFAAPVAPTSVPPDIVVAQDGTGGFTSVQAAIDSVPKGNSERRIIYIKNGTYKEKIRIETSFLTLLGEDRAKTRLVWEIHDQRKDPGVNADRRGIASFNLHNASDVVVDTLTIDNPSTLGGKPFVVFSTGEGTRIVLQNADILGRGGDSLSLWTRGQYYHRNLHVTGTYHFVGPRGTCYMSDSVIECLAPVTNALFNEGMQDERQKFVLKRCQLISEVPFGLGSHFRDAAWYFIDCRFPDSLRPDGKIFVAQSNVQKPQPVSAMFKWATDRVYFANSKGPDYPWLRDNLEKSDAKTASEITARWTFSGDWDPESAVPPAIASVTRSADGVNIRFSEAVTVKGQPVLGLDDGKTADYVSGSGTDTLRFRTTSSGAPVLLQLKGGAILASKASARLRCLPDLLRF